MDITQPHLGNKSAYIDQYNNSLLFPIPRIHKRSEIGINNDKLPFVGVDIWTHYEISWLNAKGKPQVAIGEIIYPCESSHIIESKSMKLYFNSFNNTKFDNINVVKDFIITDLSTATNSKVQVKLFELNNYENNICNQFKGINLDALDISCDKYQPAPEYLSTNNTHVSEILYSDLLKSNCLVTFQPDWGSVQIEYTGNKINHEGLLKYIISLRNHNEFHEQCVERIFNDILLHCKPDELSVYARYTRRGGLDINPFRSTKFRTPDYARLIRQ